MNKRLTSVIFGQVQGVFFRQTILDKAQDLGLTGFVKNDYNSTVKVTAEGPEKKLEELLEYCQHGPELAKIKKVEINWEESKNEFSDFRII